MKVPMVPEDPFRAVTLARAPDTDASVLADLTLSHLAFVREAAISNTGTPLSAIVGAVPLALNTDAEIGNARSIASRSDTPPALLEKLLALLNPSKLDGSRREHWPHEQLAVDLLSHTNLPEGVCRSFLDKVKVSKRVRLALSSAAVTVASEESATNRSGA